MAEKNGRVPITPARRRVLQQLFEHGSNATKQNNFEYAAKLLGQCVSGDPGNPIYARQFLDSLTRLYDNNPKNVSKLASIKATGSKSSMSSAARKKDWPGVIAAGVETLKGNPWDLSALTTMAQACEEMECDESQLVYLKLARDSNPKDANVNRHCGRALGRMGHFDQAIICWRAVELLKPGDEEANRAIGDLTVEKTIHVGGFESAETSQDVKHVRGDADDDQPQLTPEQRLQKQITKKPDDVNLYVELADLHIRGDRWTEAETVLAKALEVSGGGDVALRERLEDVQVRHSRQQVQLAERRAESEKTPEALELVKKMKGELNRVELEIYRRRSDLQPSNLALKYELGLRLKRVGKYQEAIQLLQQARADGKRKAQVHLEMGECFQALKQYPLAMSNFEAALLALGDRDQDQKKLALYRAGKLALFLSMNDPAKASLDPAEKHLTDLASLDFGYKDVPALLDKIAKMRNKG
jgi:tetratricopeptide (TPR) repeat protein